MMTKVLLITSKDCPPCNQLKELLDRQGVLDQYEIIDIKSDEGVEKLADIYSKNPNLLKDETPQCIIEKDDGSYGSCKMDDVWDVAEGKTKQD